MRYRGMLPPLFHENSAPRHAISANTGAATTLRFMSPKTIESVHCITGLTAMRHRILTKWAQDQTVGAQGGGMVAGSSKSVQHSPTPVIWAGQGGVMEGLVNRL